MKRIQIIFLLIIIICLLSCDALLAPRKPRNNPYDMESMIIMPGEVMPSCSYSGGGYFSVSIGMNLPDDRRKTLGYILVKNRVAPPVNPFDGSVTGHLTWDDVKNGSFLEDGELEHGADAFYGVWAYGGDREDYISIDESSGAIEDRDYTFSGPFLITARSTDQKMIPEVDVCGYITSENQNFSVMSLRPSWTTDYNIVSFLSFDLTGVPSDIMGAVLTLYTGSVADNLNLDLTLINQSWDSGTIDYITATGNDFIDTFYQRSLSISSDDDESWFDINIQNMVDRWVSGTPNYGIHIMDYMDAASDGLIYGADNPMRSPVLSIPVGFILEY